jgi:cytochrome c-type biogenesis protein CcmE
MGTATSSEPTSPTGVEASGPAEASSTAEAKRSPVVAEPGGRGALVSWKFWIGLLIIMGAAGFIVTSSMSNAVHFYNVDEAVGRSDLLGQPVRIRGTLVDGSHRVREGTLDEHIFILMSEQETVTVTYTGPLPDNFKDGASVIANGRMVSGDYLEADSITAQCPSRYENQGPTEGISQSGPES